MRHSAIAFASFVNQQIARHQVPNVIVTTDMCNVAEFRGLLPPESRRIPILVYFHENQLVYPNRNEDQRDLHYAFTNLTSALAADAVWFNSEFNRDSMIAGLQALCQKWPDFAPRKEIETLQKISLVVSPGIDIPTVSQEIPDSASTRNSDSLCIVWAARWEHDKNPQGLLEILRRLRDLNCEFSLNVIGETFRNIPSEFATIRDEFESKIGVWGFQETRDEYWDVLRASDIFLSTADHEFFGISVVEGLAAGLQAVLPNRLAYPELKQQIGSSIQLYNSIEQAANLIATHWDRQTKSSVAEWVIQRFGWQHKVGAMDDQLESLARQHRSQVPLDDLT